MGTCKSALSLGLVMNIILYAIPFFFALIGLELLLDKIRNTGYYRLNDAINSLSAGVLSRMSEIAKGILPFTVYVLIYQHFALFSLPDTLWMWLLAFVVYDLCYYWNHRLGHEMSLLWAAQVVHHSSEEYNLTTALRQTSSSFLSYVFYLPMALLGVDPLLLLEVASLNLVYQFWVHTRHVPELGWLEYLLVTPSNHRVHHAQNRVYIDRNYGGVFIIWDRLFGTYQRELSSDPVIFGIRSALKSWNPLYANIQVYAQLWQDSWHTARWRDKLRVWFGRTGWRPADVAERFPLVKTDLQHFSKFDVALSGLSKGYCLLQHVLVTLIAVLLMLNVSALTLPYQLALVVWVAYASYSVGAMLENRPIALRLEGAKHLSIAVAMWWWPLPLWLNTVLSVASLLSTVMLVLIYRQQATESELNTPGQSHLT